jgi:acetate CoA/acetoacetate CoA-transferase beta subunit
MTHSAKGAAKIVKKCSLPLTSIRRVNLIVTEMAVIEPTEKGLVLREIAPGITREQVIAATDASLIISDNLIEMPV